MTLSQAIQEIRVEQFRQALTDPHERGGVIERAYAAAMRGRRYGGGEKLGEQSCAPEEVQRCTDS